MSRWKAAIGLRLVKLGIWIYEMDEFRLKILSPDEKENLRELWEWHDYLEAILSNNKIPKGGI